MKIATQNNILVLEREEVAENISKKIWIVIGWRVNVSQGYSLVFKFQMY